MEEDDDLFVVIIGDEKGNNHTKLTPIQEIKSEQQELNLENELIHAEELRQQIFAYGEVIESNDLDNLKIEIEDYNEDYDNYEELQDNDEYNPYLDEDSNTNDEGQFLNFLDEGVETNSSPPPNLVHSLREDYPEWSEEELVDAVKVFMQNVKPPPLPDVYYTKNKNSRYVCVICKKNTYTLAAAGRHYEERHGPRFRNCFACGASFRSRTNLYKHEKRCGSADADIVLKARTLFLARGQRERPYMQKDNDLRNENHRYFCSMCPADFLTKQQLRAHENLHLGLRPHACEQCPARYTSAAGLKSHMIKHSDVKFECDHCGRGFKKKDCLITHLNTHLPQKKFACEECSKRYATKFALSLHERRDHRRLPPPCACALCDKRFNRMSILKEHMKSKHQMDLITRNMFLKALPQLAQLPDTPAPGHLVRRDQLPDPPAPPPPAPTDGEAPRPRLACSRCDKTYAYRQDLRLHEQRAHTAPGAVYACDLCARNYSRISVLRKHLKSAHGMVMMSRKKFLKSLPKLIEMNAEVLEHGQTKPLVAAMLSLSENPRACIAIDAHADIPDEADEAVVTDTHGELETQLKTLVSGKTMADGETLVDSETLVKPETLVDGETLAKVEHDPQVVSDIEHIVILGK